MLVFTKFLECQENVEHGRCFGHSWMLKRWYLRSCYPWRYQPPANYSIFALFEPIFCLDECKQRWYLRVFQKIEDRDVSETL